MSAQVFGSTTEGCAECIHMLTTAYITTLLPDSAAESKKKRTKTCEKVHFSLRQRQRSGISYFNTSLFKNSASASQRLAKGHLVVKMKTWQQSELERLALFPYQRDPQPVRLSLDLVWKSVSTAEILAGRVKG